MITGSLSVVMFSKDRPLQLDAALRSLKIGCADLGSASVRVLYRASTPFFATQYRVLANQHPGVLFFGEQAFKADLLRLVDGGKHVLFVVDDSLFVGRFSLAQAVRVLESDAGCIGVSLRLGRNTTYCYPLDRHQQLPDFQEVEPGMLSFDWTMADHDFGYPLELSSSVYRTGDLLPLLTELDYRNPNTLEATLAARAGGFRDARPRLACYSQSVAFSIPANLVQTAWRNRVDGRPGLSAAVLADAFSRGQRLDVQRYQAFVPNACHQEVDFILAADPDIPTVSVVVPCYAQAHYLEDAVQSVMAQTFDDWELIIVDDGSPDDAAEVARGLIERHPDRRIRLVRQANRGLSGARNAGIEVAQGRYILPLDADDMIAPAMLGLAVELLEHEPSVAIAYPDVQRFSSAAERSESPAQRLSMGPWGLESQLQNNKLPYCALYRREVWEAVGGYNPNMTWGYEDWDFWIGCAEAGFEAQRIDRPLFLYRERADTMYGRARTHHAELLRQIRRNHPRQFTWRRRGMRALSTRARGLARSVELPGIR